MVVLLGVSVYGISKLQMVYDFEAFFPKGDPDLEFYQTYRGEFGPDDNQLFIGLQISNGVFRQEVLLQLEALTNRLDSVAGIKQVVALNRVKSVIKSPFGLTQLQVLHIDEPERYQADSVKIMQDERLVGRLVSSDAKVLVVILQMQDSISQAQANELNVILPSILEQYFPGSWHLAGKATIQAEYVRVQQQEVVFFTVLSGLLVLVMLWFIYRRPLPIIVALGTVMLALVYFMGLLGLLGISLDLMSALFPILMLIVGLSDVIHLLARYQQCLMQGDSRQQALTLTIKDIGLAVLLTSATTSIGFLSLATSRIGPVQQFGYTAAIGVMMAYATAILVVPTLLMMIKPNLMVAHNPLTSIDRLAQWFYRKAKDNEGLVLKTTGLLLVLGLGGLWLVNAEARLQNDLPRREKLKTDFMFFEDNLGGFRSFEVALLPQNGLDIHHPKVLLAIDSLEQYLASRGEVRAISSPVTLYKSLHRAYNVDRVAFYRLPSDTTTFKKYEKLIADNPTDLSKAIIGRDGKIGRLSGRTNDVGSDSTTVVYDNLRAWAAQNISPEILKVRITGSALLYDNNNIYLVGGLLQGIGIAFVSISLIMALLFRSLRMVVISFVPNVLPLLLTAAFMGYLGIALDAPTTIIFTIAFGIAVDDTIHFLSCYRVELVNGLGKEQAIERSYRLAGKAMILTTIVLFFGFMVLLGSQMLLTMKVGMLVSITLVTALIGDLLLLPVLLRRFG